MNDGKRFKPYARYRRSGSSWLGELPEQWTAKPIKYVSRVRVSGVDKKTEPNQTPIRFLGTNLVYNQDRIRNNDSFESVTATSDEVRAFSLAKGDVILTKDSVVPTKIAVPAIVTEDIHDAVCGYHLALLRPTSKEVDSEYLFYFLKSELAAQYFLSRSQGTTIIGIGGGTIGGAQIPLPSRTEQHAIAEFLDRETAKIDDLIGKKERLLELLEEKRAALVTHAVTRGLNPDARLCDRGIEWLGQIPVHWEVKRSKQLFSERNDRSSTGDEEMLTVSHITGVTPRSEKEVNMFEAETTEGYKLVSPNDLVINTLWAWMGAMGVARHEGIVSPAYHVYRIASDLLPDYVENLVCIDAFKSEVTRFSKGVWSSRLRLYPDGLYEVMLPIPPLHEQRAIAAHLKAERQRGAALETILRSSIKLLQERRSALITAAVTGKIDVRNEVKAAV